MRKSNQAKLRSLNTQHIIDCYAALLGSENAMFRDEALLPARKDTLKKALRGKILGAESEKKRSAYKAAYLFLSSFLPGVGPKGVELSVANIEEWGELSNMMNTELQQLKKELDSIEKKFPKRPPSISQARDQAA
jgi:hypothetical protein